MAKEANIFRINNDFNRQARLTRAKVPGNSAFRKQVIRMVIDVKRDAVQTPFSPLLLVSHGVRQPSSSFVRPTLPPPRDHLTTPQSDDSGQHIVSFGLPFTSTSGVIFSKDSIAYSDNGIDETNNGELHSTITTLQDFQPSPLDFTQAGHNHSIGQFRPSKLLSVIFGSELPVQQP